MNDKKKITKAEQISEKLEDLYENYNGTGPIVPAGFKIDRIPKFKRAAGAQGRTEFLKDTRQNSLKRYIPDPKYTKSIHQSGLDELFYPNTDVESVYTRIKNNVKSLREYHDMSQEELAEAIGVSRQYIGQIEAGEKITSIETLVKLALVLHTNVAMFTSVDMPCHHVYYCNMLFEILSEKSEDKQLEILKKLIKYAEGV